MHIASFVHVIHTLINNFWALSNDIWVLQWVQNWAHAPATASSSGRSPVLNMFPWSTTNHINTISKLKIWNLKCKNWKLKINPDPPQQLYLFSTKFGQWPCSSQMAVTKSLITYMPQNHRFGIAESLQLLAVLQAQLILFPLLGKII